MMFLPEGIEIVASISNQNDTPTLQWTSRGLQNAAFNHSAFAQEMQMQLNILGHFLANPED